jgi:hypothetical protein
VLTTELVSKEAKLPQCTLQEAGWEPLYDEAVSRVTLVEPSDTATVSVEPMESAADLVLGVWEALQRQRLPQSFRRNALERKSCALYADFLR